MTFPQYEGRPPHDPATAVDTQRMQALHIANERRTAAAQVKRELAAGAITLDQALRDHRARTAKVWQILCARPYCGPSKADRLLRVVHVSSHRAVGQLTEQQIQRIVAAA